MNNYHYLIASLPALSLSWGKDAAAPGAIKKEIYDNCSQSDRKLFRWLDCAFDDSMLGEHLYARALRHQNKFIREFMRFDLNLRNAKVEYLNKSLGREAGKDIVNLDAGDFPESDRVKSALQSTNILEREEKLDAIVWDKVEDMTLYDYFNNRTLMCYIVKLNLIDRWYRLDPQRGAELFKQFVNEVRGTFGGIDPQDYAQTTKRTDNR